MIIIILIMTNNKLRVCQLWPGPSRSVYLFAMTSYTMPVTCAFGGIDLVDSKGYVGRE